MTTTDKPARTIDPKKVLLASLVESVFVIGGILMFFRTDELLWLIGSVVVGSVPILWVLFAAPPRAGAGGSRGSIVEDARGRR